MAVWRQFKYFLAAGLTLALPFVAPQIAAAATLWDATVTISIEGVPLEKALENLSSISSIPMEIEGRIPDRLVVLEAHDELLIRVMERILYPTNHLIVWRSDGVLSVILFERSDDLDAAKPLPEQQQGGEPSTSARPVAGDEQPSSISADDALDLFDEWGWETLSETALSPAEDREEELYPAEEGDVAVSEADIAAEFLMNGRRRSNDESLVPDQINGQSLFVVSDLIDPYSDGNSISEIDDELVPPDENGSSRLTVMDLGDGGGEQVYAGAKDGAPLNDLVPPD